MCLQSRAQFHQMLGKPDVAIRDFTEILDVAEVVYGAHHLQVSSIVFMALKAFR